MSPKTTLSRAAILALALAGHSAHGQTAAPLAPYVPPPTSAPLAPLPAAPQPADPPLGAVRATSSNASNNNAADTRSPIAPALPTPETAADTVPDLLRAAHAAILANETGTAQEALERAEARALNRDVAPSDASSPSADPITAQIATARSALAAGDHAAAIAAITAAGG